MRFVKLDLKSCLFCLNDIDINNEIEFLRNGNRTTAILNKNSIAISYSYTNKIELANCYDPSWPYYVLYAIDTNNTIENEVYIYNYIGNFGSQAITTAEYNNAKEMIKKLNSLLEDIGIEISRINQEIKENKKNEKKYKSDIKDITNEINIMESKIIKHHHKLEILTDNYNKCMHEVNETKNNIKNLNQKLNELNSNSNAKSIQLQDFNKLINKYNQNWRLCPYYENSNVYLSTKYFYFNNQLFFVDLKNDIYHYNDEQLSLLLKEYVYKENDKFKRLKKEFALFEQIKDNTEVRDHRQSRWLEL